jgi:hypothetical protein
VLLEAALHLEDVAVAVDPHDTDLVEVRDGIEVPVLVVESPRGAGIQSLY